MVNITNPQTHSLGGTATLIAPSVEFAPGPPQRPSLGRIVHVLVDPALNNGADTAPAFITRIWGPTAIPDTVMVNLRVVLDSMPIGAEWAPSRHLYQTEEEARAAWDADREQAARLAADVDPAFRGPRVSQRAFWPTRH